MGSAKPHNDSDKYLIDAFMQWHDYLLSLGIWHPYHYRDCCCDVITSERDQRYTFKDKVFIKAYGSLTPGLETGLIRYAFNESSP